MAITFAVSFKRVTSTAEAFDTSEIDVAVPPTYEITIGGTHTYTAVAPKQRAWVMAAELLEKLRRSEAAEARLSGASRLAMDADERGELEEALAAAPTVKDMR